MTYMHIDITECKVYLLDLRLLGKGTFRQEQYVFYNIPCRLTKYLKFSWICIPLLLQQIDNLTYLTEYGVLSSLIYNKQQVSFKLVYYD